jgi:hypothetical protein
MISRQLSRRRLLRLIAASTAAAALAPALHARAHYPTALARPQADDVASSNDFVLMGRAIHTVTFYEQPDTSSGRLASRSRDQSFPITGEVHAPFSAHNDLWYQAPLGFVHSAWVLPMRIYAPQPFISDVGEWGFWGEVSQPHTEGRAQPSINAGSVYRFYGGLVFHVVEAAQDETGTGWYRIFDEFPPTNPRFQWVLARDMRRIPRHEMSPLNPFVGNKRIEVSLDEQRLNCFEGDNVVFTTLIASGIGRGEGDPLTDLATHRGETAVLLKQPSRHMSNAPYEGGPPVAGDIFDLPGIPWNTFFAFSGTAIHGTYWHNDFGIRRSHGCINVACEVARWIYRWVHPIGGYEDDRIQSDKGRVGTPINIF